MSESKDRAPLSALLLAGGKSSRMGTDKANLLYGDSKVPQWKRMTTLLRQVCTDVCISIRPGQDLLAYTASDGLIIEDGPESRGPLTGLLQAFAERRKTAWLVVACDLPLLEKPVLDHLIANRGRSEVVAYTSANDGLPEPLCAIYEPAFLPVLEAAMTHGLRCPRKILINNPEKVALLTLPQGQALENANTPDEFERLQNKLSEVPS